MTKVGYKPVPSFPTARQLRAQAKQLLHQGSQPSERVVELGAVQLFEDRVFQSVPGGKTSPGKFPRRSLASLNGYHLALAGAAGVSGPLGVAAMECLEGLSRAKTTQSHSAFRTLGSPLELETVANILAPQWTHQIGSHTVRMTGRLKPQQLAVLKDSLDRLHAKIGPTAAQLQVIHVRPFIGEMKKNQAVLMGLASTATPHSIFLSTESTNDPKQLDGLLYHEFGHLLDGLASPSQGAYLSSEPSTPFGKEDTCHDSVSDYARTMAIEDMAESHQYLLENWEGVRSEPQVWIHANGKLGDKLSWLLKTFYRIETPDLGAKTRKTLKLIHQGESPFKNFEQFQGTLQQTLVHGQDQQATADQQAFIARLREQAMNDRPKWWQRWLTRLGW